MYEFVFYSKNYGFRKDNFRLAFATAYLLTVVSISWSLPANKLMQIVQYQEKHLVDCIVA